MSLEKLILDRKKSASLSDDLNNTRDINLFGMTSAMISTFLPEIPVLDHWDIYKENQIHELYKTETHTLDGDLILTEPKFTEGSYANLQKLKLQPHIITTFHLGMYLSTCKLLYDNGILFSALISSNGLHHNGNRFKDIMRENYKFDLNLIDAEKPNSALSLIKEIKSGKSLVIYLDGNLGAIEKKENLCQINFLNSKINVRKGVSFISYFTKTPIVNMFNYIENDRDIVFHVSDSILSTQKDDEKAIMESLWAGFSPYLKNYPQQWEGWRYLHKSLVDKSKKESLNSIDFNAQESTPGELALIGNYRFNLTDFALFVSKESIYILDKSTLFSYYIIPQYADLLRQSLFENVRCTKKNIKAISHLLSMKLLRISPSGAQA